MEREVSEAQPNSPLPPSTVRAPTGTGIFSFPKALGSSGPGWGGDQRRPPPAAPGLPGGAARLHLISRSSGSNRPRALKELTRNASPLWFCGRNHDCQEQIFVVHKVCY